MFRARHDEQNEVSHIKIGDALKFEKFDLEN
jgi:hypothetical protein